MKKFKFKLVEELPLTALYDLYAEHRRLQVFVQKGTTCVRCDRVGTRLILWEQIKHPTRHVDLFTDDLVLMTVDHIIPMSVSKDDSFSNKQPMCEPCNQKKGHTVL